MSREIKFRAWDSWNNKMVVPRYIDQDGEWYMTDQEVEDGSSFQEGILMQYIGIKDKNGVEIYEADAISFDDDDDVWIVRWNDEDAGFELYEPISGSYTTNLFGEIIERVGNIHQNPELLE